MTEDKDGPENKVEAHWKITLDHPVRPAFRWGHGRQPHPELFALISGGRRRYEETLQSCMAWSDSFEAISPNYVSETEPYWGCGWMSPLEVIVLYSLIALNRPQRYCEVGSGCSTTFARRAIQDHNLNTRITSIDPEPRSGIDAICDEVKRLPLEELDLTLFEQLSAGDVVFIDGSHRSFTNSDATVAVLEILPRLKPGVIVGFDDIYLPEDYPPQWWNRFYSEQYLLAAWLLGGGRGVEIILPMAFAVRDPELKQVIGRLLAKPVFSQFGRYGNSFWMRKTQVDSEPTSVQRQL